MRDLGGYGGVQESEREMLGLEIAFLKLVAMLIARIVGLLVVGSQSAM